MFDFLVGRVNDGLRADAGAVKNFIGVLDIYGFEFFDVNSSSSSALTSRTKSCSSTSTSRSSNRSRKSISKRPSRSQRSSTEITKTASTCWNCPSRCDQYFDECKDAEGD